MKLKLDLAKLPFPTGKTVISYSEIKDWLECSFRHKLKHILKLGKYEASKDTVFGTAVHASCEDYIKTRIMKPEIALSVLVKEWEENNYFLKEGENEQNINLSKWMEKVNKVLDVVPKWLDETFPGWVGIEAEELLTEEIPDTVHKNVKFKGYIDAIIKHGNYYWLLDWKGSGKGWTAYKKGDPLTQLQLVYYNLFWQLKHNIPSHNIKCGFVILGHGDEIEETCELIDLQVSEERKKESLVIINNMISSAKRGVAFKAWKRPEGEFQGACMFCEFNGTEHCPSV